LGIARVEEPEEQVRAAVGEGNRPRRAEGLIERALADYLRVMRRLRRRRHEPADLARLAAGVRGPRAEAEILPDRLRPLAPVGRAVVGVIPAGVAVEGLGLHPRSVRRRRVGPGQ
jgi:hypothetical protein